VSYDDRRGHPFGLHDPRAPWRRAARPLAILFVVQLSGIGCAARAPQIPTPTKPDELKPYLTVYQDQLEGEGITLEGAEEYLAGRTSSPVRYDDAPAPASPADISPPSTSQAGEETYKMVDGVAEYRIGPGDVIAVTTFLGPEVPATLALRVLADGSIYIARFGIGDVQAAGTTPTELTRTLTEQFRRYVPAGFSEVRVTEFNAWHATLRGEILARASSETGPGRYLLTGRTTIGNFILTHGGPTSNSDMGDVRLLRQGVERRVNVDAVLAGDGEDLTLLSGDIVFIPSIQQGTSRLYIFGEVASPGVYIYTEGDSVLDAIAQAGGYTQAAQTDAVYVSRPGTQEVIPVNLDITLGTGQAASAPTLVAGDFVIVPSSSDRSQKIRDWVGIFGLILSALAIIEIIRQD